MAESNQRRRFSNVLIVEDDDAQRATLSDIMEQEGFQPYTASNGREALDLARQRNFGVAILDFRLPDISGTELLERIHSINPNVRVVIHTGYGSFDSAKDAVNQGAFAYVEKAGDPDELLRHVHRAVQSQYDTYAGELEAHVAERTASLGESEERYRSLVEFSLDGIALHTRAGLIYVNLPGARFLGAAHPNELIGRRLRDFVRSDQQAVVDERIARIMNEKTPAEIGEVNILTGKDNETILEVRGIYTAIAGEPVVQLLLRDVTQARKDEENRRLFETRMRETQKMEVAGQLAAGIAHDFNNLLTVILGSSELLRERIAADRETTEVHRKLIEQIDGAGQRAAALTSRLLTFSRRQPVRLVLVKINDVVREMKHLLSGVLGDSVQLNLKLAANLPPVLADVSQVEQVIMNLTVNAHDAMPNGGTFTLETGLFQPDERFASQHSDLPHFELAMLRASDTGIGMTRAIMDRIFEPFFTTKPHGKGTGLGLPTVYGIVRQAGGWIDVQSELNRGTEFVVYWPAARGHADQTSEQPKAIAQPDTGTILLCEDDDVVRQVTTQMLRRRGFSVISVESANEALSVVRQKSDEIDILLSDIIMPEVDGFELVNRMRRDHPDIGVILMSGCATDEMDPTGDVTHGIPILQKPFGSEQLYELIDLTLKARKT